MPCLRVTLAYTRKLSSSGFMIAVASSLSPPPSPLAYVITAVVSRRQRGADVSAAVRRAGSLSRGGNLSAGSGPPFSPSPRPALSPFVCVLLPCLTQSHTCLHPETIYFGLHDIAS